MFNKMIRCSALGMILIAPLAASADSQTDKQITTDVTSLYAKSALLKSTAIQIQTLDNNVSLSGNLTTDMQYEEAVALAQSVTDVNNVQADGLHIKDSQSPMTDTYITAKVKGMLMKEKLYGTKPVEYWPVSIETKNGIVYLTGKVDTQEQLNNIVNIAKGISGVKSVTSTLTVK